MSEVRSLRQESNLRSTLRSDDSSGSPPLKRRLISQTIEHLRFRIRVYCEPPRERSRAVASQIIVEGVFQEVCRRLYLAAIKDTGNFIYEFTVSCRA